MTKMMKIRKAFQLRQAQFPFRFLTGTNSLAVDPYGWTIFGANGKSNRTYGGGDDLRTQSKEEKVVARLPKAEVAGEYEVESGETTNQGRSALVFSKGIEVKKVNVIELDNTVLTSESPSAVLRTGSKLLKIISTSESLSDSVEEGCDKGVYVDGVSGEEDDGSSAENDSMEEGVPGQDRPSGNEVSKDYGDDVLDSELGDFGSKSGEDTDFGSKSVSLSKELKEEYVHFTAETKKADMTEGTSQLFSCNLSQRIDDKDLGTVDNLERVSGGEEVGPKVAMAGVILDAHYVFDKMPQSNPKGHHQISEAKQDGLLSAKFCDGLSNSNEVCCPKKTWANIVGSNFPGSSRLNQRSSSACLSSTPFGCSLPWPSHSPASPIIP
ncbi:hypothetical protein U1Q18_003382 [Sarracenia purpurea var. burkii]